MKVRWENPCHIKPLSAVKVQILISTVSEVFLSSISSPSTIMPATSISDLALKVSN